MHGYSVMTIVALGLECPLWRKLVCGLPEKQSCTNVLRVRCDTLASNSNK